MKVEATDEDAVDRGGLVYSLSEASTPGLSLPFSINPHTGHLLQLRAVNRDPPDGRAVWRVRVQVRDGQRVSPSLIAAADRATRHRPRAAPHPRPQETTQKETQKEEEEERGHPFPGVYFKWRSDQSSEIIPFLSRGSGLEEEEKEVEEEEEEEEEAKERRQEADGRNSRRTQAGESGGRLTARKKRKRGGEFMPKSRRTTKRRTREDARQGRGEADGARPEIRRDKQDRDSVRLSKALPARVKDDAGVEAAVMGRRRMREAPYFPSGRTRTHHVPLRRQTRQINIDKHKCTPHSTHRGTRNTKHPKHLEKTGPFFHMNRKLHHPYTNRTVNRRGPRCGYRDTGTHCHSSCFATSRLAGRGAKLARNRHKDFPRLHSPIAHISSKERREGLRGGVGGKWVAEILEKRRQKRDETGSGGGDTNKAPELFPPLPPIVTETENAEKWTEMQEMKSDDNYNYSDGQTITTTATTHHHHHKPTENGTNTQEAEHNHHYHKQNHSDSKTTTTTTKTSYHNPNTTTENAATTTKTENTPPKPQLREKRNTNTNMKNKPVYVRQYKSMNGRCDTYNTFSVQEENGSTRENGVGGTEEKDEEAVRTEMEWRRRIEDMMMEMRREEVHVVETVVDVVVKDVNDNAPVFPNATMYGEVQENGPINLSAGVVWAWDADEQGSSHALITYSIEKNVMDERTGESIFVIHPQTGLIHTALCCLDRETTPLYEIQVVAQDGGGLKGTGTVVVRLADVNDNSPRLARDVWAVEVDETWGEAPPDNTTLLQITAADKDTSNYFYYRVVEGSGWGWRHFGIRTVGAAGHLHALATLDYENAAQRDGFRFMVQVTDRGRGGWGDARHTDTAWVEVRLRDVNDNAPEFPRPHAHVTVREDASPGTLVTALAATDPDEGGLQGVSYKVQGGWGALRVDPGGGVRLWRALDREAAGGAVGVARIVAIDTGEPPLSSTSTLTITVTDVNDCPPRLLPPTRLYVREGAPTSLLGVLRATDDDLWQLGHGPPFSFALSPSNPEFVREALTLKQRKDLDSGRGGAEVWNRMELDREERAEVTVEVVVGDAGGRVASYPVTVVVEDVNDNPMKPGRKVVRVWKVQGGGADVALGRVYVEDPDDWDLEDKSFKWAGPPHPLFTLQEDTGNIFGSSQLRERRYELHFLASDRLWGQKDVPANVTVEVTHLSSESLTSAVPLTLSPISPAALTAAWTPQAGGGGLGTLSEAVREVVGGAKVQVLIVSVYGSSPTPMSHAHDPPEDPPIPVSWVWVCAKEASEGSFMNPVKLRGLLSLHQDKLERVMNLRVLVGDASPPSSPSTAPLHPPSLASMVLPLQVVDTNVTSLVTPRLSHAPACPPRDPHRLEGDSCTPTSCLNGGRCFMGKRCLCPVGSSGPRCKVLARSFHGRGWVWVRPPAPCLPTTLSLRLLPLRPDALLLYSGPLSPSSPQRYPPPPS
ncbi:neural-cadherin-like [Scylla paramamosain]|uniref:neural-cadherin-like n=1 Tax=Scylla paramamosain TaxID=85552 RepID=UPI0030827EC9